MSRYFTFTGNTFVDNGIYAITHLSGKKDLEELNIEDVKEQVEFLTKIYFTDSWKKCLHSIFPNSTITHNRIGSPEKFKEMMYSFIEEITPLSEIGHCVICGKRQISNAPIYKDKIPLIGSGELLNFFPSANKGLDLCPGCVVAVQFMPLMVNKCGPMFSLLHSGSPKFMRVLAKHNLSVIDIQFATGHFDGPPFFEHGNPRSALVETVSEIIKKFNKNIKALGITVDLYHFSNYNQGPALSLYNLPANIFVFLIKLTREGLFEEWKSTIIQRGYPLNKKGEKNIRVNRVYENLLARKSILPFFINERERKAVCSWPLLKVYLREVEKMDEVRIEEIKRIADQIAVAIKGSGRDKRLKDLEKAKNYNEILTVLFRITKEGIKTGSVPISFDDVTQRLFPEGPLTWRETKLLLLFRLYEVLADWLNRDDIELEEYEDVEEES